MARLPYVSPDGASPEVAATLREGPPLRVFALMAHAQSAFTPWKRWGGTLMTQLELDPRLRELAILRIATLTPGAQYMWDQHEPAARGFGAGDEQIAAVRAGIGLEGDAALVVRFTEQVVLEVKPSDDVWAAAVARLSPRQIVELLQVIGQFMMLGRVMATLEIDPEGQPPAQVRDAAPARRKTA